MRAQTMAAIVVTLVCVTLVLGAGLVRAETTWVDEISNSVNIYKTNYPGSNWEPYEQKVATVREAVAQGDQRQVRTEMNKFFTMLQRRAHGINDVAADELYNFCVMVTPVQEYGISLPQPAPPMP